jgi:hypothetical protein
LFEIEIISLWVLCTFMIICRWILL